MCLEHNLCFSACKQNFAGPDHLLRENCNGLWLVTLLWTVLPVLFANMISVFVAICQILPASALHMSHIVSVCTVCTV